jgi:hypothetical protein
MTWLALLVVAGQVVEADLTRAYTGREGERVELVSLQNPPRALLRARGTLSDRDGLVLRGTLRRANGRLEFVARIDGSDWTVLASREGQASLFLPGLGDGLSLTFDAALTGGVKQDELLALHEQQLSTDLIAKSERKRWPHLEQKYTRLANEAATRLSTTCGTAVTVELRWASFDDDTMANVDVWKRCAPLEAAFVKQCEVVKKTPLIRCEQGQTPGAVVSPAGLRFVITGSRP